MVSSYHTVNAPEPLTLLKPLEADETWKDVDFGGTHTLGLTNKGRAFSWGLGMMGELGLEERAIKLVQEAIQVKSLEKAEANAQDWPLIRYSYDELKPGSKPPSLFRS